MIKRADFQLERAYSAKNMVISPNFAERHSFHIVSGDSPKTMRKLYLSAKFPHQEIGVFTAVCAVSYMDKNYNRGKIYKQTSSSFYFMKRGVSKIRCREEKINGATV